MNPLQLSVDCRRGERWVGGEFISADRVCAWSDGGAAYLYKGPYLDDICIGWRGPPMNIYSII